ncbi:extracellular solute-binding protein [Pararhizobium sp. O133]|uniref:extracellular solute-binding protein n=1 Tax=Pararhizobium sp. O133 TaxID=3449278 RepID=UPI003F687ACD
MRGIGMNFRNALAMATLALASLSPLPSIAQEQLVWHQGTATVGELKYKDGFSRFDYVNPDAPKGGNINLTASGTFDTLNPLLAKGEQGAGVAALAFETLMKPSMDEIASDYGLLAESIAYPDDFAYVKFRLRPEAKWEDGQPVTPEDVVFSFDKVKANDPQKEFYYKQVTKAEKTGDREVTFSFDEKNNRELPKIVGELVIVPKHWWEGKDPKGVQRDISKTSLEIPMGSGPYKITSMTPGATIRYELRDDYWGKNLNVNIGQNNFVSINYAYYADLGVSFEAFRSGNADYWWENSAKRWATSYDFPAVNDGRIKREVLDNDYRNSGILVGFIPNLRREKFQDERVREALNYAFDFEELKRTIFYNQYDRINSYFFGSELASSGLPQGRELEILNELKDQVPSAVFTTEYKNPVGGDQTKQRDNLRKAIVLFKEAGYELKGNRMVNSKTGEPFSFEILLDGPTIEIVALPFAQNLKKIGVTATVRTVDSSQYTNRWRSRDFDMIYLGWGQSLNPGNEQAEYWGSDSAKRDGSQNYAGISDPGIDALIRRIIFAKDRDELIATTKVLDRVLLAHHYVIPSYTGRYSRIAYSANLIRPADLPKYAVGFPTIWWSKDAAAQ